MIEATEAEIDYEALEKKVRGNIPGWSPGIACKECTELITETFTHGHTIYRPFGRPHNHPRRD